MTTECKASLYVATDDVKVEYGLGPKPVLSLKVLFETDLERLRCSYLLHGKESFLRS